MSDSSDPKKENVWPRPYLNTILRARDLARQAAKSPVVANNGSVTRFPPGLILVRFLLSIDQIMPQVPTLGRPTTIYFTLTNNSGKASSGVVGGSWAATSKFKTLLRERVFQAASHSCLNSRERA